MSILSDKEHAEPESEPKSAAESADPLIELSNVEFGYTAAPVVEDISLRINPGEYVAVVGPNGSGKSTLMKLILGLLQPDTGSAQLFGEPSRTFDDGARIGYVAQHASASKEMPITVREVVKMGRFPHVGFGILSGKDHKIVDEALATVGMSAFADRRVTQLSGGQRQRAFIARALAGEADLLVLDEPTVGVDAESVDAFYDLLESLNEDGITILLIEHDLGAVTDHAERIVCLNREVYFDGPTDDFVESDALARAFGTAATFMGDV
ncbi:metal ABC transporter ATP-binding protein [Haloferax mediterranei ATCC 33500]|uniref:Cobalamin import ATP-binding protein BtuD n=1 Tax=Haloferax mediterranei (strain ATCC 33500 / DSM 1411 / JCM 8866 / NBRC 14739 / NCIMB 2177 / R-4) TaxID=523841 RepID=I3R776_HALMT|nr:metal ABC transporter ATP-binding protein [Haloferax mediterranei]AFK20086.1 ABC-type transport system ATP-binding protein [Haloferax mediterranei ATCC 33500]AHZ23462.1 ABC transporter ATP-binding protein [Haloferax mediterranei ATCC 33500]ELZ99633.1 ABC-type transport system ATP-binding protein [Haloferax mediterranei ATCC 33500]MDX5987164.1 metal ABC transporter ATP-binding protein [Haloferax mediterranei ATCC 33500]QCQ76470.1 metal ABC transporter ATP-binding protein [Haloferax mediterra